MENDRIKKLRKTLKLNQEEFGNAIGLTKSSISNVEKGVRNVTEQHIKLITTAFNVNEHWLRTGEGSMFENPEKFTLDGKAKQHNLSQLEIEMMRGYMELSPETRNELMDLFAKIYRKNNTQNETAASVEKTPEELVGEEVEKYRLEVLAELKGETSSASVKQDEKLG